MQPHKIALCLITKGQEFQRLQAEDAKQAARRTGVELEITYGDSNEVTQIKQISSFINAPEGERPAAIVVEPVTRETHRSIAQRAVRSGVGWVLLNSRADYLDSLRAESGSLPVSSVMTDQMAIGRIQARQFRSLLPNGGQVLYVKHGPFTCEAAAERCEGMAKGINGAKIEVLTTVSDWTEEGAEQSVERWCRMTASRMPRIDLVGCQNDSQAQGARRALTRLRKDGANLLYTGCDGSPDFGQQLVKQGELAATIITPTSAGPAVELVARSLTLRRPAPSIKMLTPRPFPEN